MEIGAQVLSLAVALVFLILPGYLAATLLRTPLRWPVAFATSLLVLFHVVFWLGIAGIPIRFSSALAASLVLTGLLGAAAYLWRSNAAEHTLRSASCSSGLDRVMVMYCGAMVLVLLWRAALAPLSGADTYFRWDFLPRQMLQLEHYRFYPPINPADFSVYFFTDGIPPLVSFSYWWLYAAVGQHVPELTSVLVAAQFAAALAFTVGAGQTLFSQRAGHWAGASLAGSLLFFLAVFIGQETGLTALSMAGTLYAIVNATRRTDYRAMVLAGLMTAIGALSREYGPLVLFCGMIALAWRRVGIAAMLTYVTTAGLISAPWYIRNWILAGNPLYTLRLAGFNVNPVYAALLEFHQQYLGVHTWNWRNWIEVLWSVVKLAPIPLFAGAVGAFLLLRRHGYLLVLAAVLIALWLSSIGYTSGGVPAALRVLSPTLVVLSLTAGPLLDRLMTHRFARPVTICAMVVLCGWTLFNAAFAPRDPLALPLTQWPKALVHHQRHVPSEVLHKHIFQQAFPAGARLLSENAYAHAALVDTRIRIVPVWSPEVRFIFNPALSPQEIEQELRSRGIQGMLYYPISTNTAFLGQYPFFRNLMRKPRPPVAVVPDICLIYAFE